MNRTRRLPQKRQNLPIRLHPHPRPHLLPNRNTRTPCDIARNLESRNSYLLVRFRQQPIRADKGWIAGFCGADGHVAARKGRYVGDGEGGVVCGVVDGEGGAGGGEEFEFRPVWGELGEVFEGGFAEGTAVFGGDL